MPGGAAEDAVAARLVDDGWIILDRRLRIGRLEVDVLAQKKDVVAIVEVRGRRIDGLVSAVDSIDWQKRRHLQKAARTLFSRRFAKDTSVRVIRIDVASVTFGPGAPTIEIIEGAVEL
jgi:putative endonuclease